MPVYEVSIEIHDGEHEYLQNNYISCPTSDAAVKEIIELYGFNNPQYFKVYESNLEDGSPIAWEEIHDYRIYSLENVREAKLPVNGLHHDIDINELMHRPVLPMHYSEVMVVWKYDDNVGDQFEYWWLQGDTVVTVRCNDYDYELNIQTFSYFDISTHIKNKKEAGWIIAVGTVSERK